MKENYFLDFDIHYYFNRLTTFICLRFFFLQISKINSQGHDYKENCSTLKLRDFRLYIYLNINLTRQKYGTN